MHLAHDRLYLDFRFLSFWEHWCLTAPEDLDNRRQGWWERLALLHYASLRATNVAHLSGGLPSAEAKRALLQAAVEGAAGS